MQSSERYGRIKRLRERAWAHVFERGAPLKECDWWARWWYRLDDALLAERWK